MAEKLMEFALLKFIAITNYFKVITQTNVI
jgi:hypothetical protein